MIHLRVYGEPQTQGNKTAYVTKAGKAVLVEGRRPKARENFRSWREAIERAGADWREAHPGMPLDEPVIVVATFYLTKPATYPLWRWLPWKGLDLDKLARNLLDGLSAVILRDDSRVTDLAVRKRFAISEPPGVAVVVIPLGEAERAGSLWQVGLAWPEVESAVSA